MTREETMRRITHAAMRPELYETWRLEQLRSDANFFGMREEEADLREYVRRREPPPRPAFEVVGPRADPGEGREK